MTRLNWKTALLICILTVMLLNSSFTFRVSTEDLLGDDLFKFVWDDTLGTPPFFGGYYIVSDQVFPLKVYAVSLPDVGNYRLSNHSAVVEGVRQAAEIYPGDSEVKELVIPLYFDLIMKLNVSVSFNLVEDWETYKSLVESGNNTIIVNTHDEYLPVPEGYTKEEWTDKIADFMLNRWGTWVHAGGYPFYLLWYQNGTTEEWGENGFKRLMNHIGKGNVTCYPPADWDPTHSATFSVEAAQGLGVNWFFCDDPIAKFYGANPDHPINIGDFKGDFLLGVYTLTSSYYTGAAIRYCQSQSTLNFGIYIHLGAWQFYTGGGNELPSNIAVGFISTATAIYVEFKFAARNLYGGLGDSAMEAIQKAEREGRTIGLTEAKGSFQEALDAFATGNYKLAAAYAMQAKLTADKATAPNILPQAIAATAIVAASISIGAYYKINNKKNKRKNITESKE